ncbi:hypothetical protein DFA_05426 [Cavenderia fasciculata]|uniref:Uncharacterized protein n=1 Tax=Cavenderia fasciculata TaxID=261658 RepID=F4PL72_CACFS|nr:uncharacterized protein DFA_05426 [Cavenderia fasciculata]EGG23294.1 hypothetical protein DFA_05426 [Cavenderia fasciculata]|eukprot:XP_004361145.1 hypothetical protein DFA_05426 [Cavenderia fasciculata]
MSFFEKHWNQNHNGNTRIFHEDFTGDFSDSPSLQSAQFKMEPRIPSLTLDKEKKKALLKADKSESHDHTTHDPSRIFNQCS